MDTHHLDIVRLAWSRALGLEDSALADGRDLRVADESTTRIRIVALGDSAAVLGPSWFLERAADRPVEELPDLVRGLTQDHSGRTSGPRVLGFATEYALPVGEGRVGEGDDGKDLPLVSHDLARVTELESLCPPDDVAEAALSGRDRWFTVLDDGHRPLGGAAYREFSGFLADIAVLTDPAQRLAGIGSTVLSIATDDALDHGLIAQWRRHEDNKAAQSVARHVGYEDLGFEMEVVVT
ncbi:hypothetical protein SAMN05444695_10123 [Rhodococcus triatomae]|uniref:N-acetyltransferase domain-containing protein n=1 Tax=Rhodococcus triatomae TaxID=300028 RepID=A0A1G7Z7L3_9NOCA|nr:GNAT family N-acetyltransferase [Rhodococcus triatomae]SDH04496.1 hypothetical protein SAMN05444695_10123 [Rhodococcus triatomae]